MTQADSVYGTLRRSLDPEPITDGQGQAKITARTPLPRGWASFCSKPDSKNQAHWYATAPWDIFSLKEKYGARAEYLHQMVEAETWAGLHKEVRAQEILYRDLLKGPE